MGAIALDSSSIKTEEKLRLLKRIIWDYNISPEDIYKVLSRKKSHAGHWDFDHLFIRILERLSWYELLDLVGLDTIREKLTLDIIRQVRHRDLREKYERLRKILRGEPISFTKWGAAYRKEVRHTLFSDRWYSA